MTLMRSTKRAFSLIEIIVALSVIVLVILSATDLLVSVIRSNSENENTLVAYGLAQEGLEAVRNIRDSNWLLGVDFQGVLSGATKECLWPGKVCFPDTVGLKKDFALMSNHVALSGTASVDSDAIANYAPWSLKDVTPANPADVPSVQDTQLCLTSTGDLEPHWYQPCFSGSNLTPTSFSRYVEIDPMPYSTDPGKGDPTVVKKYRVSSVVKWKEIGRDKEVRLTTDITDWKGGPL